MTFIQHASLCRIRSGLGLLTLLCLPACASAPALTPYTTAECTALQERLLRESIAKFDSVYRATLARRPGDPVPDAPDSMRLSRRPSLRNGEAISSWMTNLYPPSAQMEGRVRTAVILFMSQPDGTANPVRILRSSGRADLDQATLQMARDFRFFPGIHRGCEVTVLTEMPVTWNPAARPPGASATGR
jgi:TonB family protein